MDAKDERLVNRAVDDALGGVGLTAFDRLPSDLRVQAIARYQERIAAEKPGAEHMQRVQA